MLTRRLIIASGAALAASSALPGFAQTSDRPNPMPEELRKAMEQDSTAPVLGNPKGDITLTEFFDYNCPFCRQMAPLIPQLIKDDPKLRIVFREWPVFGEGSEHAAQAALASLQQGKYWQMHQGLMALKEPARESSTLKVAKKVGLDIDRMKKDMESEAVQSHISRSFELGDHMGLIGTPTFIAGDEGLFGENDLKALQGLVSRGRKTLG